MNGLKDRTNVHAPLHGVNAVDGILYTILWRADVNRRHGVDRRCRRI